MNFPWEPKYCTYDVCECSHPFMKHNKDSYECYNSCYFDSVKQQVVMVPKCVCKNFVFKHSEKLESYKAKEDIFNG